MTLQRAVDRAISAENRRHERELAAAGPEACPNCLRPEREQACWLCRGDHAAKAPGAPR